MDGRNPGSGDINLKPESIDRLMIDWNDDDVDVDDDNLTEMYDGASWTVATQVGRSFSVVMT